MRRGFAFTTRILRRTGSLCIMHQDRGFRDHASLSEVPLYRENFTCHHGIEIVASARGDHIRFMLCRIHVCHSQAPLAHGSQVSSYRCTMQHAAEAGLRRRHQVMLHSQGCPWARNPRQAFAFELHFKCQRQGILRGERACSGSGGRIIEDSTGQ